MASNNLHHSQPKRGRVLVVQLCFHDISRSKTRRIVMPEPAHHWCTPITRSAGAPISTTARSSTAVGATRRARARWHQGSVVSCRPRTHCSGGSHSHSFGSGPGWRHGSTPVARLSRPRIRVSVRAGLTLLNQVARGVDEGGKAAIFPWTAGMGSHHASQARGGLTHRAPRHPVPPRSGPAPGVARNAQDGQRSRIHLTTARWTRSRRRSRACTGRGGHQHSHLCARGLALEPATTNSHQ